LFSGGPADPLPSAKAVDQLSKLVDGRRTVMAVKKISNEARLGR